MPKPLTQQLNTSQNGSSVATFDDEENVIMTVLIALHGWFDVVCYHEVMEDGF